MNRSAPEQAFGTVRHALVLMLNVPFALVGGIAAFWLDQHDAVKHDRAEQGDQLSFENGRGVFLRLNSPERASSHLASHPDVTSS